MATLTGFLGAFPATDTGEAGSRMRGAAFATALDDMPAWAVAAACRDWLRGEHGAGGENYAFAPSPPQLRRLAARHIAIAKGRAATLEALASAVVEPEYSDEHRRQMLGRLAALRLVTDPAA